MEGKKILLTVHPSMHADLVKKADARQMSLQELIISTLRTTVLAPPLPPAKKSNAGRPKKGDEAFIAAFTRGR